MTEDGFPNGWDEHRADQIRWIAKNTTPLERYEWLCRAVELFGDGHPKIREARAILENRKREAEQS